MNGKDVIARSDSAFAEQQANISVWNEAMSYCVPRKKWVYRGTGNGQQYTPDPKLQNSVASKAARDLASGMLSAFMNSSEMWAIWEPSDEIPNRSDRLHAWYENNSKVAMRVFEPAGLYGRMYEFLLDAVATGTAAMKVEGRVTGSDSPLNFETWDVGSYAIAENSAGHVDRVWREYEYTIQQAMDTWPDYRPERWARKKMEDRVKEKECFILEIIPRDEFAVGMSPGPMGMEYQGTIVSRTKEDVVWEGGWPEFPVLVYRFQRQSGCNPWGVGPGIEALPDCRGTNFLDTAMADGYGKMVDPPLAIKDDMRGILDATMGGVTAVSNMAEIPRPIFEVGQGMQSANAYLEGKKRELEEHFYKSLFTPLLNDQRTLKAAQVYAMQDDLLKVFAPFGHRFLGTVSALLERSFMILLREGLFGKIPPEAFVLEQGTRPKFLYPKVTHQSRMALEIQNLAKGQVRQLLMDIAPIATIAPEQLDWINFPQAIKLLGGNSPVMPNILRSEEEFYQMQAMKAQAAQQQQAMEFAAKFAEKNPDHAAAAVKAVA